MALFTFTKTRNPKTSAKCSAFFLAFIVGAFNAAHQAALPHISDAVHEINEHIKHLVDPLIVCGYFHSKILAAIPFLASANPSFAVISPYHNLGLIIVVVLVCIHHFAPQQREVVDQVKSGVTSIAILYGAYTIPSASGSSHYAVLAGLVVAAVAYTGSKFYSPPVNHHVLLLIKVASHVAMYFAVHTIVLYAKAVSALPHDAPAAAVDAAAAPAAAAASP